MRSLEPAILPGSTRHFARSPTVLKAQTSILRAGVDVATVDESVAADDGNYAAGSVENSAGYVAVVKMDESVACVQRTGADVDSNSYAAAAAAVQFPRGPTDAAVQHPRRGSCCHPSDDRC